MSNFDEFSHFHKNIAAAERVIQERRLPVQTIREEITARSIAELEAEVSKLGAVTRELNAAMDALRSVQHMRIHRLVDWTGDTTGLHTQDCPGCAVDAVLARSATAVPTPAPAFVDCLFETRAPKDDGVNHPKHYNRHPSGVECIDIIEHMPHNVGAAMKYLWRAGLKSSEDPVKDLRKAAWYATREADRLTKAREKENGQEEDK